MKIREHREGEYLFHILKHENRTDGILYYIEKYHRDKIVHGFVSRKEEKANKIMDRLVEEHNNAVEQTEGS